MWDRWFNSDLCFLQPAWTQNSLFFFLPSLPFRCMVACIYLPLTAKIPGLKCLLWWKKQPVRRETSSRQQPNSRSCSSSRIARPFVRWSESIWTISSECWSKMMSLWGKDKNVLRKKSLKPCLICSMILTYCSQLGIIMLNFWDNFWFSTGLGQYLIQTYRCLK